MNRAAIATSARRYLNDKGTDYLGTTALYDEITAAAEDLNIDSTYNRADATVSIRSAVIERSMPTSVLDVYDVRLGTGSDRKRLTPTTRAALDRIYGDWEGGTAGTPTQYYLDGQYIGFYPRPATQTVWTAAHHYAAGSTIVPPADNGFTYVCNTAGTSAASAPTWPTTIDGHVTESGGPSWQQSGNTFVYIRCLKNPDALSNSTSAPTWLPKPYHRTIAKKTALNIAGGMAANNETTGIRLKKLYDDYQRDAMNLRKMGARRSVENVPRITPTGYSNFRR